MRWNIVYMGLDVDDTQYHGSALDKDTGKAMGFKYQLPLMTKDLLANSVAQALKRRH